ncbi:MAG: hypothetical protein ACQEQV_06650 [Fibrobacterota bacterium]
MRVLIILCISLAVLQAEPIPLYTNSWRAAKTLPVTEFTPSIGSPLIRANHFRITARNQSSYDSESFLVRNRALVHFFDSLGTDNLHLKLRVRLDQGKEEAYDVAWNDTGTTVIYDLDEAQLTYRPSDKITLSLGKQRFNWGPLELGGLLLSDYNQGFTALYQEYDLGPFTLKGVATQLNSVPWSAHAVGFSPEKTAQRYFSAARMEYYRETWGIALAQSLIYAGETRSFEIPYLLPFFPFHYAQMSNWREGNHGENTFGGIDGYYRPGNGRMTLYGEMIFDDLQDRSTEMSRSIRQIIGGMAGVRLDTTAGFFGFAEGGQINSFVYNHIAGDTLRYLMEDAFIGSPLGPDQRLLWGRFGKQITPRHSAACTFWLRASGERTITTDYTIAETDSGQDDLEGSVDEAVPFGTVEHERSFWLTWTYTHPRFAARLRGGYIGYENYQNTPGESSAVPFASISIGTGVALSGKENE